MFTLWKCDRMAGMVTQPPVSQVNAFTGLRPVQKSIWKYICDVNAAQGMLALARKICPNAILVDSNDSFFGGSLVYYTEVFKAWSITGFITVGSGADVVQLQVLESAAWLLDRSIPPPRGCGYDVWVDRNPDGSIGGPNLHYTDVGGVAQFYWGV